MTKQKGSENYQVTFIAPRPLEICITLLERQAKAPLYSGNPPFWVKLERIDAHRYQFKARKYFRILTGNFRFTITAHGYLRRAEHNSTEVAFSAYHGILIHISWLFLILAGLGMFANILFMTGDIVWGTCGMFFVIYGLFVRLWSEQEWENFTAFIKKLLHNMSEIDADVYQEQYFEQE